MPSKTTLLIMIIIVALIFILRAMTRMD
ncbi:hemin uptake protein HemP, partial [Klebsiella variicola]